MNPLKEAIKIAEIHATRIRSALKHVAHLFPMKAELLDKLPE